MAIPLLAGMLLKPAPKSCRCSKIDLYYLEQLVQLVEQSQDLMRGDLAVRQHVGGGLGALTGGTSGRTYKRRSCRKQEHQLVKRDYKQVFKSSSSKYWSKRFSKRIQQVQAGQALL